MHLLVIVKGAAGLGNRLITICNAIDYARQTERILLIDWSDGQFSPKGVNSFPLFFKLKNVKSILTYNEISEIECKSSYPPIWKDMPEKSVWDLYRRGGSTFVNKTILRKIFRKWLYRRSLRKLQRHWYLYSEERKKVSHTVRHAIGTLFRKNDICVGGDCPLGLEQDLVFFIDYAPLYDPHILYKCIGLKPFIEKEINEYCKKYKLEKNTIGVHVRMTDAMPANSFDKLYEHIRRIPLNNPQIFLATDSDEAKKAIKKKYPNAISIPKLNIGLPKGMGRHYYASRVGLEAMAEVIYHESVLDMFLLSKCEYLVAQKNSAFSKVAAVFKNEPSKIHYW